MFAGDHMRRKMEDQWETYLRDTHLATPTKHAKGDKGRNEAAVHFVQNDVRSGDIDQVLVRFIELIDVEKLVISARDDLARLLIEDDAAALSVEVQEEGKKRPTGKSLALKSITGKLGASVRTDASVSTTPHRPMVPCTDLGRNHGNRSRS